MADSEKSAPEIRFRGFTDAWEQRKLGEVCKVGDIDHWMPKSVSNGIPYLMTGDFIGINGLDFMNAKQVSYDDYIKLSKRIKPEKGDLLFARYASIGLVRYITTERKFLVSYSCAIIKPIDSNGEFAFYQIQTKRMQQDIEANINSSSQRNIGIDSINKLNLLLPQKAEQTAIGSFFRTLDDTIVLYNRQLEGLKQLKRGYLQQMFPQEGERVPQIRFADFSGPWEQKKLGEVAEIVGGGTPDTSNPDYWNGKVDWYSPTEIGEEIYAFTSQRRITELGLSKSSAKILPADKTILFTSRAGIGEMAILKKPAATNQGFQSLVVNENFDVYFVYSRGSEIKNYALKNASGSTFLEISSKNLSKMELNVPTLTEQIAIGNFFRVLDEQITAQQNRLDKLKQLKTAYLQKMFI